MLGTWFAISCHFIFRDQLLELAKNLIEAKETQLKQMAIVCSSLMAASFAVQICNYEVTLEFENPASWTTMLVEKCGEGAADDGY